MVVLRAIILHSIKLKCCNCGFMKKRICQRDICFLNGSWVKHFITEAMCYFNAFSEFYVIDIEFYVIDIEFYVIDIEFYVIDIEFYVIYRVLCYRYREYVQYLAAKLHFRKRGIQIISC